MSNNKKNEKHLIANMRPSGKKILFAWFFLLIIPSILFLTIADFFLKENEVSTKQSLKVNLQTEMTFFRESLKTEKYLYNKLTKIIQDRDSMISIPQNTKQALTQFSKINIDSLREKFEKEFNTKIPVLMAYGPDTISSFFSINPDFEDKIKYLPTRIMQQFLLSINEQVKRPYISNQKLPFYMKRLQKPKFQKKLAQQSQYFLKSQFATAGKIYLKPFQIHPAISNKPFLGKIYFFFIPLRLKNSQANKGNLGGFVGIIRERDISFSQILSSAKKASIFKNFKRSIIYKDFKSLYGLNTHTFKLPQINLSNNRLFYSQIANQETFWKLLSKPFFKQINPKKIARKVPFLLVSTQENALNHEYRKFQKPIKNILLFMIIFVSIIMLRIFLFGFSFPIGISMRLFVSIVIICGLPYMGLIYFSSFYLSILKQQNQSLLAEEADQLHSIFSQKLNSLITRLENKNQILVNKLETVTISKKSEFKNILSKYLASNPIDYIRFYCPKFKFLIHKPGREPDSYENFVSSSFVKTIYNTFNNKSKDGTVKSGFFKSRKADIDDHITNLNRLNTDLNAYSRSRNATLAFFGSKHSSNVMRGAAVLKYSTSNLLEKLKTEEPQLFAKEENAIFSLQKCFIPGSSQALLPKSSDFICEQSFPIKLISPYLKPLLKNSLNAKFYIGKQLLAISYLQDSQCLAIQLFTPKGSGRISILPSLTSLVAYLIFLATSIVYYLARSFTIPIRNMENAALEIQKGNLSVKLHLQTSDEFHILGTSFNNMVEGLRQRKKLSQFVSEDVLKAIQQDLHPGGERVESCIVFCSLKDFNQQSNHSNPKANFRILSCFLDIISKIVAQYGGVIDKIIEDTLMIVFLQKNGNNQYVINACNASLMISSVIPSQEIDYKCGIGISSGKVISGKIGSKSGKLDFTVIGNPVNLAARLKAETHRTEQTGILVCPSTVRKLRGKGRLKYISRIPIKGRTRTFPLYELTCLRN